MHYAHNWTSRKICLLRQTSCGFPWRLLQTAHSLNVVFCRDWMWPATATINVIQYTSRFPEFVQDALYCEPGWSVSACKVPPKLSLSLDNWFRREIGLCNLDPLLHWISRCLIHWSWKIKLSSSSYHLPGKQKPGLIWYEMIAIRKWIQPF